MSLAPLDQLALLLRPAGGGVHVVSTGAAEQRALQQALYGTDDPSTVRQIFRARLEAISRARVVLLAVPSDVGAGYRRGSNLAPQAIRIELQRTSAQRFGDDVLDLGDVFCVPQLLSDEMLSEAQISASRRMLYPEHPGLALPVSPLSIAERALELVLAINPNVRPVLLGGDHSIAWPAVKAITKVRGDGLGIVQPDAHTDLLENRLGVKICFATWSYHANDLIGRGGRLVQVGVRASRFPREHWESTLGVRQFWGPQPVEAIDELVAHLRKSGVRRVYFSNDIDGTDAAFAPATGTPESGGLSPDFVIELIRRVSREFELTGGDVVEVAPSLGPTPEDAHRTVQLAARYVRETIEGALRSA